MFVAGSIYAQTLEAHYQMDGGYTDLSGNDRTPCPTDWDGTNSSFDITSPPQGTNFFKSDVNTSSIHFLRTEDGAGNTVNAPASLTGDNPRTITAWESKIRVIAKNTGLLRCEKAGKGFDAITSVSDSNWHFVAIADTSRLAKLYEEDTSNAVIVSGGRSWIGLAMADNPIMVEIDLDQRGVAGDNSWGSKPQQKYLIKGDEKHSYSFYLIPFKEGNKSLFTKLNKG